MSSVLCLGVGFLGWWGDFVVCGTYEMDVQLLYFIFRVVLGISEREEVMAQE